MLHITMIGCGAIGVAVLELLEHDRQLQVDAVIASPGSEALVAERLARLRRPPQVLTMLPTDARPDLLLECAGHRAIEQHVLPALERGIPCLVVSVGALSRAGLVERLEQAAARGDTRIELLPGAIGGIDALSAAKVGGLDTVEYTGRKPAQAWKDTPAEQVCALDSLSEATVIFQAAPARPPGCTRRTPMSPPPCRWPGSALTIPGSPWSPTPTAKRTCTRSRPSAPSAALK